MAHSKKDQTVDLTEVFSHVKALESRLERIETRLGKLESV